MAEVRNRKVLLKRYVTGYPAEDDMEVVDGTVHLAVPQGLQAPAVLLKNLYLSCDAWMRGRMSKRDDPVTVVNDFVLGEVRNLHCSLFVWPYLHLVRQISHAI